MRLYRNPLHLVKNHECYDLQGFLERGPTRLPVLTGCIGSVGSHGVHGGLGFFDIIDNFSLHRHDGSGIRPGPIF